MIGVYSVLMEALEIDRTDTNQYPCVFGRYKSDGTWCFELCFLNLNKRLRCNLGLETRIVKSNCLFSIGCFHWLVCNHLGDEVWKFSHIVQSFKWKIKIFLLFIYFFIFFIFGGEGGDLLKAVWMSSLCYWRNLDANALRFGRWFRYVGLDKWSICSLIQLKWSFFINQSFLIKKISAIKKTFDN